MVTDIIERPDVKSTLTRSECEEFFIHEASLLDRARFDEWFELFTPDAVYEVPQAGDPDTVDSSEQLFYIADDYFRLKHRVMRMQKEGNHSEWPASVCMRMIGNVRLLDDDSSGTAVESKFVTYRTKNDVTDAYYGHHHYILRIVDGKIRIASKRTFLDMNSLRQQGKVTIFI